MILPAAVRPTGRARSGLIRVASVPAGHVYVRHLADPSGGDGVVRLDDPVPAGPDVPAGQWWPPAMLSPAWVLDHHQEFDVFHVQFGFDAQDADRLGALVHALRAVGNRWSIPSMTCGTRTTPAPRPMMPTWTS
jgi:hypothetical protein